MTSVSESMKSISGYRDHMESKKKDEEKLGMNDFLTMLVAQLEHQDPLNPMESEDFTTQLTQFSQLEAQFNSNKILSGIEKLLSMQKGNTAESYLNKYVTASVDTIDVTDGKATGGFYTIKENADISVVIYDEKGKEIRTLAEGQKAAGSYPLKWDGLDKEGNAVPDGTYKFGVKALTSSGYSKVDTVVRGKVESVLHNGNKKYIVVKGVPVSPDSVVEVRNEKTETGSQISGSFDYLGKNISASNAVIKTKDGKVTSSLPSFIPEVDGGGRVSILNSTGQVVYSYYDNNLKSGKASTVQWDGKAQDGKSAPDGYYSYIIDSNIKIDTGIKGPVTGVYFENNRNYLDIDGVMVVPEDIEFVES